jgi:TolB-like protein
MHDDILTQLANLSGFDKVISRTSMERYRDSNKSIPQIGQELGVATILEGGVQRAGDRVRINMQLINAATDEHIWANTYDRELSLESLFEIQTEIAREVVTALHAVLTDEDEERLASLPTGNLKAYEQYVLGRQELARRTAESLAKAVEHFAKAIELDPDYALAYVGLADSIGLQVEYADLDLAASSEPRRRYIDKALDLNPLLGEAYAALGLLLYWEREIEDAEAAFRKAIELSPNYPHAYHWYSILLLIISDRGIESLDLMRKAVSLDPAAPILIASLVDNLKFLGRIEEAEAALLDGIKRNPEFPNFYIVMRDLLIAQGRIGEAAVWLNRANELNPTNIRSRSASCHLFLELDDLDAAEDCLTLLRLDFPELPPMAFAGLETNILIVRGEAEAAVEYARELVLAGPDPRLQVNLVGAYLMNAEWDKAGPMLEVFTPKFFAEGEIVVDPSEVQAAINAAATMREGDEWSERGQYLAGKALETMQTMHRTRGISFQFLDIPAHGIRGDFSRAIAALRQAIDSGWRFNWWLLRTPSYDSVRDDETYGPEWNALIAELEADIAEQRQWYYENAGEHGRYPRNEI